MPKIGLALSGGAAFGFAHIAVLRAFDQLGLKPHAISGTSMGAIAAACYGSGHSADALLDHSVEAFSLKSTLISKGPKLVPAHIKQSFKVNEWKPS